MNIIEGNNRVAGLCVEVFVPRNDREPIHGIPGHTLPGRVPRVADLFYLSDNALFLGGHYHDEGDPCPE